MLLNARFTAAGAAMIWSFLGICPSIHPSIRPSVHSVNPSSRQVDSEAAQEETMIEFTHRTATTAGFLSFFLSYPAPILIEDCRRPDADSS